ncbi:MAG: M28 family peptidase, partial [Bacteroidota bacterium]|nr:M28 family peptidase [Bacteroidota bacterium]
MIIRYKKHLKLFCSFFLIIISNQTHAQTLSTDSLIIRKIFDEALLRGQSYEMLDFLSNKIGGRLSGSPQAAAAVDWSRNVMKGYNFDTVYLQEVMVPRWIRGEKEEAGIINLRPMRSKDVPIAALGGSIATPKNGLTAKVVEVHDFEALKKLGTKNIQGKIVFFNRPMDARRISTFEAYGGAVDQRGRGAAEAAKFGAVGVIVRSMSLFLDDYPHTGAMNYKEGVTKIPAGAISTNAAELLSSLLKEVLDLEFYMKINSYSLPDVLSHNVVGEIRGTEKPDEIIVVGGHLDSWDLGDGAHDDGAG